MINSLYLIIGIFSVVYVVITVMYFFSETSGNFPRRAVNKIVLATLFFGFFLVSFFKKGYMSNYGAYQIVGLIGFLFAYLGDVFLLWNFVVGGVLFMVGNISLFIYEILLLSVNGIPLKNYWWCILIFAGLMFYIYASHFSKRIDFGSKGILMPIYVTSVSLHGTLAFGIMANASALSLVGAGSFAHFSVLGLGLFLFMVSDYFLITHEYVNKNNWVLRMNSGTYFIGMMLAAISFAL